MTRLLSIALIVSMSGFVGCAPWSTYPPVETTARLTRPSYEPVPTVLAEAVRYTYEKYMPGEELAINLPKGVPAEVYLRVVEKLGAGRPMYAGDANAIHIEEVRTRGFNAQVDLIYSKPDGFNQMTTLTLKRTVMENYRVKSERPWRVRNVAVPGSNYPPNVPFPPKDDSRTVSVE